ncbi:MAG: VWA domain-containing protein [Myxococcales bacterium]
MNEAPLIFAQPEFAGLFWIWAAAVACVIWYERRSGDALGRFVGSALQNRLVMGSPGWRRWGRIALLAVAGAAMITALMQPQWGVRYVASPRVGAEIMIALDVSRSMLADDAKPTRLERAKAEISDLLAYLDNDYVGLIVFAGRANVLSPMTPDKSFLRLALDSAGPHSVTRGGTRLAEPIRRAVAGMGEPGPAQRALILITDGEDHDSFVMDEARAAAEAGIKIIAIGFGDESGSQIYLRDAKTGARTLLRDGEGRPVVSRLDGDLLREIALATDGAYVPAGTGVLDLASIYEAHIADLTRGQLDERGRTIRDEAYQFFVLLALVSLIGAVSISSVASRGRSRKAQLATSMLMIFAFAMPAPWAHAQTQQQTSAPIGGEAFLETPLVADDEAGSQAKESTDDPRQRFNRANEQLGRGDPIAATALLRDARRDATDDAELRYAATYNLGMAAVARADTLLAEGDGHSAEALDSLYEAADWFRKAAAARPDETDPRHNLDVTLRRALILADEIAQKTEGDLESEIDAMILEQRERILDSAALLAQVGRLGELDAAETLRPAFRQSASSQRILLSEATTLAERVEREYQRILAVAEEQKTPEDVLRGGQLEGVLDYLDQSIDRMGQTRRQLRQRRAERAYRRGSAALGFLKRARDQLRDPVEQIDILLAEVGGLARTTLDLSGEGLSEAGALPAHVTPEAAEDESLQIQARIDELAARFDAASKAAEQSMAEGPFGTSSDSAMPGEDVDEGEMAQRLALIEAAPLVGEAARAMGRVSSDIGQKRFPAALEGEVAAGTALAAARESFFDLRQVLNVTFADESQIAVSAEAVVSAEDRADGGHGVDLGQARKTIEAIQEKNQARALRLEGLLDREERSRLAEIEANASAGSAVPQAGAEGDEPDPAELEVQRFDLARQRLALASGAMMEATDAIRRVDEADRADWPGVQESAARAAKQLDALRSLFFTIAEHVRKLAADQVELQDQTQDAAALSVAESTKDLEADPVEISPNQEASAPESPVKETVDGFLRGPDTRMRASVLVDQQGELRSRADQIADALRGQAEEMAAAPSEEAGPDAQADALRIQKAAEYVASAGLAMSAAGETLQDDGLPIEPALPQQTLATLDLKEALALLSPPPEESPPDESDESENDESGEGDDSDPQEDPNSGEGEQDSETSDEERMDDPSQLLQGVRDREAERRRDLDRRKQQRRAQPVEKDW